MALLVGQYLGNYYLCELLGSGGYADVYRCEHKDFKTEHAIKVMQKPLSYEHEQLFLSEVKLHAQMKHPSIVNISDWDTQQHFFLVMEYVSGGSLSNLRGQQIELPMFLPYIKQLADAIDYIHQHQIVHCDIKLDNFLLKANNVVVLSDFGIAVEMTQHINSAYGTLEYVSPEQLKCKPCPASDQYSLAITIYELLTGKCPFDNIYEIMQQVPPSLLHQTLPGLSQEIEDVVFKALEKQPQNRYPSVTAFAEALEQAYLRTLSIATGASSLSPASLSPAAVLKMTRKVGTPIIGTSSLLNTIGPLHVAGISGVRQGTYTYLKHTADVVALTWSSDGTRIASADINNAIHIWNALDGSNTSIHQGFSHMILNILWSPDNLCIAVADEVQAVQFWDNKTGKKLFRYQHRVGKPDEVGIGFYYPMVWSRDGRLMISASDDQPLEKWDTTTGMRLLTYMGHVGRVNAIAWSADERAVASGGVDSKVHIWDATSGDTQFVYTGHRGPLQALSWSPTGKRIASAGKDGFVHIWNANDGSDILIYNAHRPRVINTMMWSPDGTKIASAGDDKKVRIWNPINGQTLAVYTEHTASVTQIAWSPNGEYLASASNDGTVCVRYVEV